MISVEYEDEDKHDGEDEDEDEVGDGDEDQPQEGCFEVEGGPADDVEGDQVSLKVSNNFLETFMHEVCL